MEFDQRLSRALEVSASKPDLRPEDSGFPDSYLTLALYRLNSVLTSLVDLDQSRYNLFHEYKLAPACNQDEVKPGQRLCRVLEKAVQLAEGKTIGAGHFLKAVVALTLDEEPEEAWGFPGAVIHNTFSAETLLWGLGHSAWTALKDAPELRDILAALDGRSLVDDTNYLLALEDKRLVVRPVSALGSYRVLPAGDPGRKQMAFLSHLREQFGSVTADELLELEDLINNRITREQDLQEFFERHPHFLRRWDFREVFPQIVLTREDDGPLIPDFILVDRLASNATILDLKLPKSRTVVAKRNRGRFSALVEEARAQLLEYRDWFDDRSNRESLKKRFGLEIYRPRLAAIIGSRAAVESAYELQKLRARTADIEVVTYDDILDDAKRRLLLVKSALR
jgi:hypothetical protein